MQELDPSNYHRVSALFADLAELHGSVRAVLGGTAAGRVLVDAAEAPNASVLYGPEGVYLAGAAVLPAAIVREILNGWDYVIASPRLGAQVRDLLPNGFMRPHQRVRLAAATFPVALPSLPAGYSFADAAEPLAAEILFDGVVVASCTPDMTAAGYAEVGIRTHPDHRRRGLATAAARAVLHGAGTAGFTEIGWHCLASNRGSLGVARAAGFSETHRYLAHSADLPAENIGDLSPADCRVHAEALEGGVAGLPWLGFYVAGAWTQANENERALAAVARLVASDWQGQPEWLEQHWSFAPLRSDPRFVAAVEIQRAKS